MLWRFIQSLEFCFSNCRTWACEPLSLLLSWPTSLGCDQTQFALRYSIIGHKLWPCSVRCISHLPSPIFATALHTDFSFVCCHLSFDLMATMQCKGFRTSPKGSKIVQEILAKSRIFDKSITHAATAMAPLLHMYIYVNLKCIDVVNVHKP